MEEQKNMQELIIKKQQEGKTVEETVLVKPFTNKQITQALKYMMSLGDQDTISTSLVQEYTDFQQQVVAERTGKTVEELESWYDDSIQPLIRELDSRAQARLGFMTPSNK